jgi:hypothetical protein
MVDVTKTPENSFGYVPTPAIVAPIEFTIPRQDYRNLGGHDAQVRSLRDIAQHGGEYSVDIRSIPAPTGGN